VEGEEEGGEERKEERRKKEKKGGAGASHFALSEAKPIRFGGSARGHEKGIRPRHAAAGATDDAL
jgi:hypothetical protein